MDIPLAFIIIIGSYSYAQSYMLYSVGEGLDKQSFRLQIPH